MQNSVRQQAGATCLAGPKVWWIPLVNKPVLSDQALT